jgi:glyoxylase-like metal-dependent hydrolase (beta-lactamase superfamily II)
MVCTKDGAMKTTCELPVIRLGWPVSNAWLLPETGEGPVLIDTGFPSLWPAVLRGLGRHGLEPRDLSAAILTHRHSDHAGNASLLSRLGVPVYAGRADAEVLSGRRRRPRLRDRSIVGGAMCVIENNCPTPRLAPLPLEPGEVIRWLEVIPMPGHTAGSIFLWHEGSATLFSGDTLLNAAPPLTVEVGLTLPYPAFCDDYPRALSSLEALLDRALPVRRLCAGHGPARDGGIDDPLAAMLESRAARGMSFGHPAMRGRAITRSPS